jgi:cation diffusion facilitator CzcD-associated flavoprotein CzcO
MAIVDLLSQRTLHSMADAERQRFDNLEAAGFKLDRYGSIMHHLYNRMGGHYIDVGTSAKISKRLIKIKTSTPTSYTEAGILFDDGTELDADVIVFATGFEGNMRYLVRDIFGEEIAEQMGDFWGLDEEGEIKGAWKGTGRKLMAVLKERTERANEHRSHNVVSWWNDRAAEVLLKVHCSSDQGEDDGVAYGGLR